MKAIENVFQGTGGQLDLLNTLHGGSSQATFNVEKEENKLVVCLKSPGVGPEAFNVLVEGNKLVLYTLLTSRAQSAEDDQEIQKLAVPMFMRVLDIPVFVDSDQIDAVYEHGRVTVTLPFKDEEHLHRRIDIKNLF
ncbi:Hsp20/alpha crystallin family protein [Spirosoma rhododendri]|uniref:Hsp20/alpha crystallin family protein n=1 Tax=Spirosoma rhododendri TaxID=2728024 RepID=A0A7L5DJ40_9BACT|nr:Hsp20 family protein [Spirosoma rhododendri]QJD78406.1 Hsp20/alpha crystallin family protein [Spirosoma rhododendri]